MKKRSGWDEPEVIRTYFHHSDLQTRWALANIADYPFRGDESVLDYGSGDGKLSAMLSAFTPRGSVLGVDLAPGMVEFASKMFPRNDYPQLTFRTLDKLEGSFDLITSFCVFHLIPNPKEIFAQLFGLLKTGGRGVFTFPTGSDAAFSEARDLVLEARMIQKAPRTPEAASIRQPDSLRVALEESGFKVDKLEKKRVNQIYASKQALVEWCEGTLTGNWNIPRQDRRELLADVVERYCLIRPEDAEGFITLPFDRIDVRVSK